MFLARAIGGLIGNALQHAGVTCAATLNKVRGWLRSHPNT